jgi:glutamine synthetase
MRAAGGYGAVVAAAEAIGTRVKEHIANYGVGIEERLTGAHETAHWSKFSYGVSDRGASVRIPGQVAREKKGYIEDRRPNANVDPYVVARLITETVCGAASAKTKAPAKVAAKKSPAKKVVAKKAPAKKAAARR